MKIRKIAENYFWIVFVFLPRYLIIHFSLTNINFWAQDGFNCGLIFSQFFSKHIQGFEFLLYRLRINSEL